jgi:hypothetical protein
MSLDGARLQTIPSTALSERSSWTNAFCVLNDVDLSSLPYFQLRDMFDSEGNHLSSIAVAALADFTRCKNSIPRYLDV